MDVLEQLKDLAGPGGWISDPRETAPYLCDERSLYEGAADLVLRPRDTEQVAAIVRFAAAHGIGIVPQGGNTGYCGGAVPKAGQVLLNLSRLNRIREIDPAGGSITVEAGCILKSVQDAADTHGLIFPLSLAAEGSCQIGGNLSTNAGGIQVLRYGNARDLVLGLEVVTASGEIWNGLRALRKDNTGYDLKHLFIGAEGTLGIITAAVLKLLPKPKSRQTCFVAAETADHLGELLVRVDGALAGGLESFEYIARPCIDMVLAQVEGPVDPMEETHTHYALLEAVSPGDEATLRERVEEVLGRAFEDGLIVDAVIAESGQQAASLWQLRESIPEAQKRHGGCIKHDIAVPVASVPKFLKEGADLVNRLIPGAILAPFGHMGDGNIHFNLCQPETMEREPFLDRTREMADAVHQLTVDHGGSFSAEHGIGLLKLPEMARHKSDVELDLLRAVKRALDPEGIMNPGKVIPG